MISQKKIAKIKKWIVTKRNKYLKEMDKFYLKNDNRSGEQYELVAMVLDELLNKMDKEGI